MTLLNREPVIEHIWKLGLQLKDGLNSLIARMNCEALASCIGFPPRTVLTFTTAQQYELKSLFQQECAREGILFTGAHNMSWAHTETDIQFTLDVYEGALRAVKEAHADGNVVARLEGPVIAPIFRRP